MIFRKPDGSKVAKTRTGGSITVGAVNVTDTDLGALLANEYIEYEVEAGVLDLVGRYRAEIKYENSGQSETFYGGTLIFDVVDRLE